MIRWISVTLGALSIIALATFFYVRQRGPETPDVVESSPTSSDPKPAKARVEAKEDPSREKGSDQIPPGAIRLTSVADLDAGLRGDIREAMRRYIDSKTIDGKFVWVEPEKKLPIGLSFKGLHDELYSHGNYYLSCAEFSTGTGYVVDLDIVADVREGMVVGTNNIFHEMRPERAEEAVGPTVAPPR